VLVFDEARGVSVLFGGSGSGGTGSLGDTWTFDGSDWTQLSPATSPDPVSRAAATYDPTREEIVMHGGGLFGSDETWTFDGTTWALEAPTTSPPPLNAGGLAYSTARDAVLLFGGQDLSRTWGETWEWNGTTWGEVTAQTRPIARSSNTVVTDAVAGRVLSIGGYAGESLAGTWVWTEDADPFP
jgi:hypothetical protein